MRNSAVRAVRRGLSCAALPAAAAPHTYNSSSAEVRVPGGSRVGRVLSGQRGVVAYDGDRGTSRDYLVVETGRSNALLSDSANSTNDVMNSSITDFGAGRIERLPAHRNTLGYDSDVFDLGGAPRHGADRFHVRLGARQGGVRLGALFLQADVRR